MPSVRDNKLLLHPREHRFPLSPPNIQYTVFRTILSVQIIEVALSRVSSILFQDSVQNTMSDSNSVPNSKFDSPLQTLSKHTFPNGITAHYFISPSRTVGLHRQVLFLLLSFSPILSSVPNHATQLERNILHPTPHACSVLLTLPSSSNFPSPS